jgi:hypothetical protein
VVAVSFFLQLVQKASQQDVFLFLHKVSFEQIQNFSTKATE